jgi:hypothetical protein
MAALEPAMPMQVTAPFRIEIAGTSPVMTQRRHIGSAKCPTSS